jgi:hypothetical protein
MNKTESPNIENLHLVPAIGISCSGCELRHYGVINQRTGQTAACIELAGNGCLSGFIWVTKKETK